MKWVQKLEHGYLNEEGGDCVDAGCVGVVVWLRMWLVMRKMLMLVMRRSSGRWGWCIVPDTYECRSFELVQGCVILSPLISHVHYPWFCLLFI
jgi:hypothetical protein